ncbi:MAG: DUF402 domain-containing protein [Actinomycetota bacterium]
MSFPNGHVVTYRELCGDSVMTALPLRVVADTPELTVLYLAPETTFRAGRAPGGGPVRDLSTWESVTATWVGGSFLRLVPAGRWYCVDLEFNGDRQFTGYYVNFQHPTQRTARGFDTVDLVLDLVVEPDGTARTKDTEDFEAAVADGHITRQVADRIRKEADRIGGEVADGRVPLDADRWLGWTAAADWGALELRPGWDTPPHP